MHKYLQNFKDKNDRIKKTSIEGTRPLMVMFNMVTKVYYQITSY